MISVVGWQQGWDGSDGQLIECGEKPVRWQHCWDGSGQSAD